MGKRNDKMMGEEKALVCFLDKKWFYTTRLQRGVNHLHRGPHKSEVIDRVKRPRVLSRLFNVKVMFMRVVTKPLPKLGFYGRIFLKRISERKVWKKTIYNQCFPDNAILNYELMAKIGGCRSRIKDNALTFFGQFLASITGDTTGH